MLHCFRILSFCGVLFVIAQAQAVPVSSGVTLGLNANDSTTCISPIRNLSLWPGNRIGERNPCVTETSLDPAAMYAELISHGARLALAVNTQLRSASGSCPWASAPRGNRLRSSLAQRSTAPFSRSQRQYRQMLNAFNRTTEW